MIATVQYAYPDGPIVQGELVRRWIEPRRRISQDRGELLALMEQGE